MHALHPEKQTTSNHFYCNIFAFKIYELTRKVSTWEDGTL